MKMISPFQRIYLLTLVILMTTSTSAFAGPIKDILLERQAARAAQTQTEAAPDPSADWIGRWSLNMGGSKPVTLTLRSGSSCGTYTSSTGGTGRFLNCNWATLGMLSGRFSETNDDGSTFSGTFSLTLSDDLNRFSGKWKMNAMSGSWSGKRVY